MQPDWSWKEYLGPSKTSGFKLKQPAQKLEKRIPSKKIEPDRTKFSIDRSRN
jgi:hypothetical protein